MSPEKEKGLISSSPGCSSILLRSRDALSARAGVPVLRRPTSKPISLSRLPRPTAAGSPRRPEEVVYSPINTVASMKVPVVSTTVLAEKRLPRSVITPRTSLPEESGIKSVTVSWKRFNLFCRSRVCLAIIA